MIADRHSQERISFRMLLTSEPLSCTMPSSSVCHATPLHVIMGVCMSTSTTAIPGPCTSRGKSMTHHIACHFQRRQCPCADSLVGIRDGNIITFIFGFLACDGSLVGIRRRIRPPAPSPRNDVVFFDNYLQAATHSSGLFRTRVASVEAFILRLSRIHDFVLKHSPYVCNPNKNGVSFPEAHEERSQGFRPLPLRQTPGSFS